MKQLIIILLLCQNICAQTIIEIEVDLLKTLEKITRFGNTGENNADSLVFYNQSFSNKLLNYASKHTAMLNYNFPNIDQTYWSIATSPDKKFRIYSWDTHEGGSMHFYQNIFQWKDYNTLYAKKKEIPEGEPGGFYSQVFQLTDELNTFYMCYYNSILSSRDGYQAIHCMDFERKKFDPEFKKIKTKSGITNKLGFSFNVASINHLEKRSHKLIMFNKDSQTLSIPVVNKEGKVSSKTIFYRYDGDYFVKEVTVK